MGSRELIETVDDLAERSPLVLFFSILFAAFCLRLAAYFVLSTFFFEERFFHPDSLFYHAEALRLVETWEGGTFRWLDYPGFANLVAAVYYLLGPKPLLVEGLGMFVGALASGVGFLILREVGRPRAGVLAGSLLAVDPSLVYWSTPLLRDIWFVLVTLLFVLGFIARGRSTVLRASLVLSSILLFLLFNRPEQALTLGLGAFIAVLVWRLRANALLTVSIVGLLGGLAICQLTNVHDLVVARRAVSEATKQHVEFYQGAMPKLPISNCLHVLAMATVGLGSVVFLPLPWNASSFIEAGFAAVSIWTYILVGLTLGAVTLWFIVRTGRLPRQERYLLYLAGLPAVLQLAGLGLIIEDMGPIVRWRIAAWALMLLVMSLILERGGRVFSQGLRRNKKMESDGIGQYREPRGT